MIRDAKRCVSAGLMILFALMMIGCHKGGSPASSSDSDDKPADINEVGGVHAIVEMNPGSPVLPKPDEVAGEIKVLTNRLDPKGRRGVQVKREGDKFLSIDIPFEKDTEKIRTLLSATGRLQFLYFSESKEDGDMMCKPGMKSTPESSCIEAASWDDCPIGARPKVDEGCVVVTGADFKEAGLEINATDGTPGVGFELKKEAADRFFKFTQRHTDYNRQSYIVIVFDGKVISSPYIKSAIFGGKGQIEGKFTRDQVKDMVDMLNAGALPVDIAVKEIKRVPPKE